MGTEFPVTHVEVRGGIRDHIHEYPHADGGAPEKMGRKLYEINMTGDFQNTFRAYPNLWPQGLKTLRTAFERQLTGDLVIPTIGTIKAYAKTWTQTMEPKASRSGEIASFVFQEDQTDTSLVKNDLQVSVTKLAQDYAKVDAAKAMTEFASEKDISLFDALANAINSVLAVFDTIDAIGNLISAKILAVADLCAQLSHTLTANDMRNAPIISALHDLWDTAQRANDSIVQAGSFGGGKLLQYVVPATMSVSSISIELYGNTSHGVELMQLNPIEDAFAVRAGMRLKYIEPSE